MSLKDATICFDSTSIFARFDGSLFTCSRSDMSRIVASLR